MATADEEVVDLMAALEESVRQVKEARAARRAAQTNQPTEET